MILEDILDARILVEIDRHLTFGTAAEALSIPAATLSRRVARMEKAAGLKLFERTTRRIAPTEAGSVAIEMAHRVADAAGVLDAALDDVASSPRGTVRVTAMPDMATVVLPQVTAEFLTACPDCQLVLSFTDQPVDLIAEGFDVALRTGGPGRGNPIVRRLGSIALRLYAKPDIADTIRTSDDLVAARLGFFGLPSEMRGTGPAAHNLMLRDAGGVERLLPVRPVLKANDFGLLRSTALLNDLVVGMPLQLAEDDVRVGRLAPVLHERCGLDIDLFAVMPSRTHMRPAVRAFVDIAARAIRRELRSGKAGA